MPVITVDGKKVAIPKVTLLFELTHSYFMSNDVLLNGKPPVLNWATPLNDGDVITTTKITFTFQDIYHNEPIKEVKVHPGTKLATVLPSLLLEEGRYNIFLNGRLDTNNETVLHDGDTVHYQKVIPIRLQECITYIPEETTLLQLYSLFRWSAKNGLPTVNGTKEPLSYIIQRGDAIQISKNH